MAVKWKRLKNLDIENYCIEHLIELGAAGKRVAVRGSYGGEKKM